MVSIIEQDAQFEMRMENTGNCQDTYSMIITNEAELRDKGITIEGLRQISLDSRQNQSFDIVAKTSGDTSSRAYSLFLKVTSQGSCQDDQELVEKDFLLILKVVTFQLDCWMVQALQYSIIAAAIIITGVFVYIKKFKGPPVLKNVE